MRIASRLRIVSGLTLAALALLAPLLIGASIDYDRAKSDAAGAGEIRSSFFETQTARDQYLLYREESLRQQWEDANATTDLLINRAAKHVQDEAERTLLRRMQVNTQDRAVIFERIVANSDVLKTAAGDTALNHELDRRLASQLLLKAIDFRHTADELAGAAAARAEQAYQGLLVMIGLFAVLLSLITLFSAQQIGRLIGQGLTPLYAGAQRLASGDLTQRFDEGSHDEFGALARAFNAMTDRLQSFTERLEAELEQRTRSEAALVELNRNFVAFLENTSDFIYFKDETSRIRFCSQTLAAVTGHSNWRELNGKNDSELFPPDMAQIYQGEDVPVFRDGLPLLGKIDPFYDLSGKLGWVSTSKWPLRDDGGQVVGLFGISRDISEQKRASDALAEALSRLQKITSRVPGIVVIQLRLRSDGSFCVPYASESLDEIYGLSPQDVRDDASPALARVHPDDLPGFRASIAASARTLTPWRHEYRLQRPGQPEVFLASNALPQREADGSVLWCGFISDISAPRAAEEKLKLAASVFTHSREAIMITNADGAIIDANEAFTHITGYPLAEVVGRTPRILGSGRHGKLFYAEMWRELTEKGHWYGEIWNRRKNGEVYAVMQNVSAVRDSHGNTSQYVALFSDITSLKMHEQQLEHLAHYDALTALPNRVLLADRLRQGMTRAQRHGQMMAVAYLDLDGFKAVNDAHGHQVGDQLLIAVASQMRRALREGDTLARLGGDEFVAVLGELDDVAASVPMLSRLLDAAAERFTVGDLSLQVSASVGVTFYPQADDVDAELLLRQADQAMYQAKLAGRKRYHIFDAEQDRSARGHHESLERIRQALKAGEFVLHYQPKVNARSGALIGAEALIRWQHPDNGLLLPAVFLPVIEDHPLAVELGDWVIFSALAQISSWQAAGFCIPVSVNVGARQLQQSDFVDRLRSQLAAHPDLAAGALQLEVLESCALHDLARVSQVIEACRTIGVLFALDDFGAGYSSLTYLKRLPVAELKIDQSFVRGMLDDPDDLAILDGVINLAGSFGRQVIAEGVESVAHGKLLLQLGCLRMQGYGIARPMPAGELRGWAASWQPDPQWAGQSSVSHDDLPLLFARAEHCAWIALVSGYLQGERDALPADHDHCRFSHWLATAGRQRYAAQAAFPAIGETHRKLIALANALCQLRAAGNAEQALARLPELHSLRDQLLALLAALVIENGG
jgi:diguanylate cyclase (GGDEF)-like protein/PAS domain S-box-containing protein